MRPACCGVRVVSLAAAVEAGAELSALGRGRAPALLHLHRLAVVRHVHYEPEEEQFYSALGLTKKGVTYIHLLSVFRAFCGKTIFLTLRHSCKMSISCNHIFQDILVDTCSSLMLNWRVVPAMAEGSGAEHWLLNTAENAPPRICKYEHKNGNSRLVDQL